MLLLIRYSLRSLYAPYSFEASAHLAPNASIICREVGFTEELTRQIVSLQPVGFKGRLYSKEHKERFRTEHSTAIVERNPQEKGQFQLCIDGMPILEWFRMKFQELKEKLGVNNTQKEDKPKQGLRM